MAGTRQHILPRFLLRGFRSRTSGVQIYTWVQPKAGPSFEANILNVLVEGKFYKGGRDDVDVDITNLESRFAPVIEGLRQESSSRALSIAEIPELIVHLSIRTKNLRDSFFDASAYLFKGLIAYLDDSKNLVAIVRRAAQHKRRWFREIIEKERKKAGLNWKQLAMLSPSLEQQIIDHIESSAEQSLNQIAAIKNLFTENLERVMKDGHLNALAKALIPEPRLNLYKKYNWHLIVWESEHLILGDAGPIHQVGPDFKAYSDRDDVMVSIYLPIGTRHLLAGTMCESVPSVDPEVINKGSATCAREYIVGSGQTTVERYKSVIGLRGFILSNNDLERILEEVLSDL